MVDDDSRAGTSSGSAGRGIDRRTIIKRAAATGAVAWTAPLILDSLASPAGAITGTCSRFRVEPSGSTGTCTTTASIIASDCPVSTTQCSPTDVTDTALSTFCITSNRCNSDGTTTVTFTIGGSCDCTFLVARGETNLNNCDAECFNAAISPDLKTATFPVLAGAPDCDWVGWSFIVQCAS